MTSIIYSYQFTYIQAVSIAFSLLILAWTVILLDSAEPMRVVINDEEESSKLANDVHDIENSKENVIGDVNQREQDIGTIKAFGYCTTTISALQSSSSILTEWIIE